MTTLIAVSTSIFYIKYFSCCETMLCRGMKVKSKIVRPRNLIVFTLISIFIWWAGHAVLRYWSQPLSTDISYNFDDVDNKIQFPLITFCRSINFPREHPIMKKYTCGSWDFLQSFMNCLKTHENWTIKDSIESLPTERKQIIEATYFWTASEYFNIEDQLWSPVFHQLYGPCHTFDVSKSEKYKLLSYKGGMRPGFELILNDNNSWNEPVIILHSNSDLPDAYLMNDLIQRTV